MTADAFYKVYDIIDFEGLLAPAYEVAEKGAQELTLTAPDTPPELQELGLNLGSIMKQEPNVLIVNRHNGDLDVPTYRFERFPQRLVGRVAVVSLDSLAYTYTLAGTEAGGPRRAKCLPGTMLVMDAGLRHVDTPPLEGHIRHTLLFGNDPTKIAA